MSDVRVEPEEIEAKLLQHPYVNEAFVFVPDGGGYLQAYVAADLAGLKALERQDSGRADTEIVDRWNKLYELTYSAGPAAPSFVGWKSSYTRQPIPESAMREWLRTSVMRIQALKPRKVLEIGCGVGLLLQHLAPQCSTYVGTDFSAAGLAQLRGWIKGQNDLQHVELLQRSAVELQDIESGSFDTVVLNSVVQYFPNIEYLLAVLRESVRVMGPNGNIFIGDVRHLGLLPTFHSAVQLSRAADSVSVQELRRRSIQAVAQETELAVDPQLFFALPGILPNIGWAEVQLRRGTAQNELTRYRYDAVLHGGDGTGYCADTESLVWNDAICSVADAVAAVRERRWASARLSSIPNCRLAADIAARHLIASSDANLSASELRRTLASTKFDAVDPEIFWEMGLASGYEVSVGWGSPRSPESFEVLLVDRNRGNETACVAEAPAVSAPWDTFANDPSENSAGQRFILRLRQYLVDRLPGSQIPLGWTVLKQLPRAPDGSVDRRAL
jgi:ubiquinone/menaquinone biosynthesis C-methylase UbiE